MNADKIRTRVSYMRFKKLLLFLRQKPDEFKVLKKVHRLIDDCRGFHSEGNSVRALESIRQLKKDVKRGLL